MITFVITFRLHPVNINENVVHTVTILYLINCTVHIDINKQMDKKKNILTGKLCMY